MDTNKNENPDQHAASDQHPDTDGVEDLHPDVVTNPRTVADTNSEQDA